MSETALLEAVRDQIVQKCGLDASQCDVELDSENIPTAVGDLYVVVHPAAWRPGPQNDSGGVLDEVFDVAVTVIKRSTAVPRDRRRNVLIDNLDGLNVFLRSIITAVGQFHYEVNNQANAMLEPAQGFIEPLRFRGMNSPQAVGPETFAAKAGSQLAGLKRTVIFGGARRMQVLGASTT